MKTPLMIILGLIFVSSTMIVNSLAGDPLENFRGTYNIDLSGTTYYIMKTTTRGAWHIKAIDTSGTNAYRYSYSYVSGDTDYVTAWSNRAATGGVSAYKTYEGAF
jgi:hypothetical protein